MESIGPTATDAQRAAIASLRARYERSEIEYETLRQALDALVAARSADECEAILRELPVSPRSALAALDPPVTPMVAPPRPPAQSSVQSIVAVMAQTKKLRRPWVLQPEANVTAFMGEIKLDLGQAALPPRARIHVRAVMADVTLYVPTSVRVTVRSRVYVGEAISLGEGASGIVASSHEEHVPAEGTPRAQIEIDVLSVMSTVKVVLTDGTPRVSIGELVRETLALVGEGLRRGLQQGQQGAYLPTDSAGAAQREPAGD